MRHHANDRDNLSNMRYESNNKHSEPWQPGRKGTLCPRSIDKKQAAELLAKSEAVGKKRYAVLDGHAYCAQQHILGVWHGYPVGWVKVPEILRRKWQHERLVSRSDIRRHWD